MPPKSNVPMHQSTNSPSFSVIIPNWNGAKYLPECINSLMDNIDNTPHDFEVILVDNGSKDNSIEIFEKTFCSRSITRNYHTKIIKLDKNYGFAGAVNRGIDAASCPYVCLLNNDLIIDKNWFNLIAETINTTPETDTAAFSGTVLTKNGKYFESQGLDFNYSGKCTNISNGMPFLKSDICDLKSYRIWGASAALIVYKKDILNKIGGFDEEFFAYEEDVDVALRLAKAGYSTLYIPQAISYHLGGGTSGKMGNFRHIMDAKNWIYIIIKNFSSQDIFKHLPGIIEERLRNLSGLIKNTRPLQIPSALIRTYGEVILKLPSMLRKRQQFQSLLKSISN